MKVYVEPRDVWVGYYRGDEHHYICPVPCVVIRWRRSLHDGPHWSDGDPWRDWTLVEDNCSPPCRWAVHSRLAYSDQILSIKFRPAEQVVGTVSEAAAEIDAVHVDGLRGYRMQRPAMLLRGRQWGPYPPHYTRGFDPLEPDYPTDPLLPPRWMPGWATGIISAAVNWAGYAWNRLRGR